MLPLASEEGGDDQRPLFAGGVLCDVSKEDDVVNMFAEVRRNARMDEKLHVRRDVNLDVETCGHRNGLLRGPSLSCLIWKTTWLNHTNLLEATSRPTKQFRERHNREICN